jgi:hypothetical protein
MRTTLKLQINILQRYRDFISVQEPIIRPRQSHETIPLIVWDIIGKVNKKSLTAPKFTHWKNISQPFSKIWSILYENGADFATVHKLL